MSKKKVNPRRIPRTEADIDRAIKGTVVLTKALMIQAALDEGTMRPDDVSRTWDRAISLSESCNKGYISIQDIYDTLKEEYGLGDL